MKLKVIVHEAEEGGYWAEVPSLPGCVTQGETWAELLENMREAASGWLAHDDFQFDRIDLPHPMPGE